MLVSLEAQIDRFVSLRCHVFLAFAGRHRPWLSFIQCSRCVEDLLDSWLTSE